MKQTQKLYICDATNTPVKKMLLELARLNPAMTEDKGNCANYVSNEAYKSFMTNDGLNYGYGFGYGPAKSFPGHYEVISLEKMIEILEVKLKVMDFPLNSEYIARYQQNSKEITVGCQTFELSKLRALLNEIDKLNG